MKNETARTNMISQQLRTNNITDESVIDLFCDIPREHFVPTAYQSFAYSDLQIPLAHGQTMMTPLEEASVLQAMKLKGTETVLEIGTGSGFLTALLARQAKSVVSIDIFEEFTTTARQKLSELNIDNVSLETGNAERGWMINAPYDAIVLTGSTAILDDCLRPQLLREGRLFAIIGQAPAMTGLFCRLDHEDKWQKNVLFETNIQPLISRKVTTDFML